MKYLGKNGLRVKDDSVWHEGNFDPSSKSDKNHKHTKSEITDFPTSLPANGGNADTVGGKHASDLISIGDTIQNTNPFGGRKLYINTLDNALAGADKKYYVTVTVHKKVVDGVNYPKPINSGDITLPQWEDSPIVSTLSASPLFNNAYEDSIIIPSDSYAKIRIDFNEDGTKYFKGYPYGVYYLSYYYTNTPSHAQVRCYNGFAAHTIGYKTLDFSDYIGDNTHSNYIQQCIDDRNYQRREIEFIVFGHPDHITRLTQIEWKLSRPNFASNTPIFSNYGTNKSYNTFNFGTQNKNNISINPDGSINALKYYKDGVEMIIPNKLSQLSKDINFDERYYTETEVDTKLNNKVDNSRVLTDVPANAKFTDTITTINGKTGAITKADIVALGIPAQDTNTTYAEITTAEIDAGTSSTLRTITARRLKYLSDKIVALFPTKTSELINDSGFLTTNDLVPNISIGKSKPTDGSLIWYEEI